MVVILMGAAGSGSTIGRALAADLQRRFVDGAAPHPLNVAKTGHGTPLADTNSSVWLRALHDTVAAALDRREHLVVVCPILKDPYRETERGVLRPVRFVHLRAGTARPPSRLGGQVELFTEPAPLAGQPAHLEKPSDVLIVDATWPLERIISVIRYEFGL